LPQKLGLKIRADIAATTGEKLLQQLRKDILKRSGGIQNHLAVQVDYRIL
jgi:hypothetical protein